ncbi:Centrosomal protein of 78 kDa [Dinochytrium kinnereticum]|nr:Centrosomal protein of 78 kDa [Dinochytrium kinnereticum]
MAARPSARSGLLDRGGTTSFGQAYFLACQQKQRPLLPHVVSSYLELCNKLHIDGDKLKKDEDWEPILRALKTNKDLAEIHFFSDATGSEFHPAATAERIKNRQQTSAHKSFRNGVAVKTSSAPAKLEAAKRAKLALERMLRLSMYLASAVKECISKNTRVTVLQLAGIPLSPKCIQLLGKGIQANGSIRKLSLSRCGIGDSGLLSLASGIRSAKALQILDLSACDLSADGAALVADLLKSQAVQRQAALWETTLRAHPADPLREGYMTRSPARKPHSESALNTTFIRVNLCCNRIGDLGCDAIMESLREEMGLLALDLQMNNITDVGGRIVDQILQINREVMIIDIRNNSIDRLMQNLIFEQLDRNTERALSRNSINAKRITSAETDLYWLDPTYPLLPSFFDIVSRYAPPNASVRHTISSLKKRTFPKNTEQSRRQIPGKKTPSGSLTGLNTTQRGTRESTSMPRRNVKEPKSTLPLKRANSPTRLPQVAWDQTELNGSRESLESHNSLRGSPWRKMDNGNGLIMELGHSHPPGSKIKFLELNGEQDMPEARYDISHDTSDTLDQKLLQLKLENDRLKETIADILTSRTQSSLPVQRRPNDWVRIDGLEMFEEEVFRKSEESKQLPTQMFEEQVFRKTEERKELPTQMLDGDVFQISDEWKQHATPPESEYDSEGEADYQSTVEIPGIPKATDRNEAGIAQETLLNLLEQSLSNFHAFMDRLDMMEERRMKQERASAPLEAI